MCIVNGHARASVSNARDETTSDGGGARDDRDAAARLLAEEDDAALPPSSTVVAACDCDVAPPPPRVPLGHYGGALSTIDESPPLRGSVLDPSAHRRSASLTLPATTHSRATERRSCTTGDVGYADDGMPESQQREASPILGDVDAGLIVDFPRNDDGMNECYNDSDRGGDGDDGIADDAGSENGPSDNSLWDTRGRCVRHPQNKLRRKKISLGRHGRWIKRWEVLMVACPDCCMEELARLQSEDDDDGHDGEDSIHERVDKSSEKGDGEPIHLSGGSIPLVKGQLRKRESCDTLASSDSSDASGDICLETSGARSMSLTIRTGRLPLLYSFEPPSDHGSNVAFVPNSEDCIGQYEREAPRHSKHAGVFGGILRLGEPRRRESC